MDNLCCAIVFLLPPRNLGKERKQTAATSGHPAPPRQPRVFAMPRNPQHRRWRCDQSAAHANGVSDPARSTAASRLGLYREILIAERFAAIVVLGRRNSRIRDAWDIAALAHRLRLRRVWPATTGRAGHSATTRSLRGRPRADLLRRSGLLGDVVTVPSSDPGSGVRAELACRSRGSGSCLSDTGVEEHSPWRAFRDGLAAGRTVAVVREWGGR